MTQKCRRIPGEMVQIIGADVKKTHNKEQRPRTQKKSQYFIYFLFTT